MELNVSYVVDEANRRQAVQIPYAEWKQLKQRLLDAEMQFWEVKKLEAEIRRNDLFQALTEVQEIEAGHLIAETIAEAFAENIPTGNVLAANDVRLVIQLFRRKAEVFIQKYPLLRQELLLLQRQKITGFATALTPDYLSIGWSIERKKSKQQPAMRIEVHFICRNAANNIQLAPAKLYLAAIYDKSEQKLVQPNPF